MDSCMSSPTRLNNKLKNTMMPCSERNPGYYQYIYRTLNTSCSDLEDKLRHLSYQTSPLKNYSRYPLASSFGSFMTSKYHYPSNRMNRFYYTSSSSPVALGRNKFMSIERAINDKNRIINQFCNLTEIAIDKMGKLADLNMTLSSKVDQYVNKSDPQSFNANTEDDKRIIHSLCQSVEKLEKNQFDCNKRLNSMMHSSTMSNSDYNKRNDSTHNYCGSGYYSPRIDEKDLYMTREHLYDKSKDYSNSEAKYERKIKELKEKITCLEKEMEHIKYNQNHSQQRYQSQDNKLMFN